jgi:hypothetical protein
MQDFRKQEGDVIGFGRACQRIRTLYLMMKKPILHVVMRPNIFLGWFSSH